MSNRVLVVAPSHGGVFLRSVNSFHAPENVVFDVASIHGAAYTSEGLASASNGRLKLWPVLVDGIEHKWFTVKAGSAEIDLTSYMGVLFLDPLFISGGFMRHRLWGQKKRDMSSFP